MRAPHETTTCKSTQHTKREAANSPGFPFGQNHEGRSSPRLPPLFLGLPAHRLKGMI
jgi:hypothetical protein